MARKQVATCCCCGQVLPPRVKLPAVKQRIYDYVAANPQGVSTDEIARKVYADDPNGGPDDANVCIRTHIWRINNFTLIPLGLAIRGRSGPESKYSLIAL